MSYYISSGYNSTMTDFDERAKDWDTDPAKVDRARAVADAIRRALDIRPGMTALEYGCGTGLLSFFLQSDFASIILADTSQGMLEVLRDKIKVAKTAHMHPVRLDLAVDVIQTPACWRVLRVLREGTAVPLDDAYTAPEEQHRAVAAAVREILGL